MLLKPIPNFPHYCITKGGQVWSVRRKRFLTPYEGHGGLLVVLCENTCKFRKLVHRLVLEVFIGLCPEGMVCCHNDGDFNNNNVNNLRWDSRTANELDKHKHGTITSKLTTADACFVVYLRMCVKLKYREIAKIVGCSMNVVNSIVNRRKWKHIWKEMS